MRVYRISRLPFSGNPLDGEGSYRFGGRWSSAGVRVVYAAEHRSLAALEYLVHLDPHCYPDDLVISVIDIPDDVRIDEYPRAALPLNWTIFPAPTELCEIGDRFVQKAEAAVLKVPSALIHDEYNLLINPVHPDSRAVRIVSKEAFQYDGRLLQALP
jgi:RES domain-containing protein